MATRPKNLTVTKDRVEALLAAVKALALNEVLVGFPDETADRKADPDEPGDITNASLGYIHDNGAPEQNIPARPFMIPGIVAARTSITSKLMQIAKAVATKGATATAVDQGLHQVGIIASGSIKKTINAGIPPPLADSTVRARARKGSKGAMWEMAWRNAGAPPGVDGLAKPLVDTAQMRNAVTYVVRNRKKRK